MRKIKFNIIKEFGRYDKSLINPLKRKRIDITLPNYMIRELKIESKRSKIPISRMIEERFK